MAKGFFKVENVSDGRVRFNINGIIGDWGNSSEDVVWLIESTQASEIEVVIQSPGGSAFEGIAIYNALKNHPGKVTTRVLAAAASAASIIFMAGDERIMPQNSYLMIHEPSLRINGKAKELREAADFLDNLTVALVSTYLPHINIVEEQLIDLIEAETWINANDSSEMGFATEMSQPIKAAALSNDFTARFENLPDVFNQDPVSGKVEKILTINDYENCLRESGCSKRLAQALVAKAKQLLLSESEDDMHAIFNKLNTFKLN